MHLSVPFLIHLSQFCFSSNQIARFYDHQYLKKESNDILVFLHRDIYLGKLASETTTFDWMWPSLSLKGN